MLRIWNTFLVLFYFTTVAAAGTHQVNADGSFQYMIPIELPAGKGGLQPNLSLEYNSNHPNGIIGKGWQLQGLPYITRVVQNEGVNFRKDLDHYMSADGLLKEISGNQTLFRSVNDRWKTYRAYGDCGEAKKPSSEGGEWVSSGPCYWVVQDNDGYTYYYGGTSENSSLDGRIFAIVDGNVRNDPVRVWALKRVEDRYGNRMDINYTQSSSSGYYQPSSIQYSLAQTEDHKVTIWFDYQSRLDHTYIYPVGTQVLYFQRLQHIRVVSGGSQVRRYDLIYEEDPQTYESLLKKFIIRGSGNQSWPYFYEFDWSESNDGSMARTHYFETSHPSRNDRRFVGDFNGDGRSDLLVVGSKDSPSFVGYKVMKGTNDGFELMTESSWPSSDEDYYVGDFNGDGKDDFIVKGKRGQGFLGYKVYYSNGSSFENLYSVENPDSTDPSWDEILQIGDFNGDGKDDFMFSRALHLDTGMDGFKVNLSVGIGFTHAPEYSKRLFRHEDHYFVGDFNGDFTSDIMDVEYYDANGDWDTNNLFVYYQDAKIDHSNDHYDFPTWKERFFVGDFNGDGLSDLLFTLNKDHSQSWHGLQIMYGTFDGFADPIHIEAPGFPSWGERIFLGDFNGDGRTDLFVTNHQDESSWNGWKLFHAVNRGFVLGAEANHEISYTDTITVGDFNGDGLADLITQNTHNWSGFKLYRGQTQHARLLKEVKHQGLQTTVDYQVATQVANAVIPQSGVCDNSCVQADKRPSMLVTAVTQDLYGHTASLFSRKQTTKYEYHNRLYQPGMGADRRSLGFEEIKIIDERNNTYQQHFYHQDYPLQGRLKRTKYFHPNSDGNHRLVSEEAYEYQTHSHKYFQHGVYNVQLINKKTQHYEIVDGESVASRALVHGWGYDDVGGDATGKVQHELLCAAPTLDNCQSYSTWERVEYEYDTWSLAHTGGNTVHAELRSKEKTYDGFDVSRETFENTSDGRQRTHVQEVFCLKAWSVPDCADSSFDMEIQTTYYYNADGRIDRIEKPNNQHIQYGYSYDSSTGHQTVSQTLGDYHSSQTYNKYGQLVRNFDRHGVMTDYEYDAWGQKTWEHTNQNSTRYSYGYDANGIHREIAVRNYVAPYNAQNPPEFSYHVNYQDPLGFVYYEAHSGLDQSNLVETRRDVAYGLTQGPILFESQPHFSNTQDAQISWNVMVQDTRHRTTHLYEGYQINQLTDATWTHIQSNGTKTKAYVYRAASTLIGDFLEGETARYTVESYDAKQRLTSKRIGHDSDNVIETKFQYMHSHTPSVSQVNIGGSESGSGPARLTYRATDSLGREIRLRSQTTKHVDDVNPETHYYYDANHHLIRTEEKDRLVEMDYNFMGQLKEKRVNGKQRASYIYYTSSDAPGARGQLKEAHDPSGVTHYEYDGAGNVSKKIFVPKGFGRNITIFYKYDGLGRLVERKLDDGAVYTTPVLQQYEYYPSGWLKKVTLNGSTFAEYPNYHASGAPTEKRAGSTVTEYEYHSDHHRLERICTYHENQSNVTCSDASSASFLQNLTYDYNHAGNVVDVHDHRTQKTISQMEDGQTVSINTDETRSFEYDEANRLTKQTGPAVEDRHYLFSDTGDPSLIMGEQASYTFDRIGAREFAVGWHDTADILDDPGSADHPANATEGFLYYYDYYGNVEQKRVLKDSQMTDWHYQYDGENNLIAILENNQLHMTMAYDHTGQRIRKVNYRYDTSGNLLGKVSTYYIDGTYELRHDSVSGRSTATQHIYAGAMGKIASIHEHSSCQDSTASLYDPDAIPFSVANIQNLQGPRHLLSSQDAWALGEYFGSEILTWTNQGALVNLEPLLQGLSAIQPLTPHEWSSLDREGSNPHAWALLLVLLMMSGSTLWVVVRPQSTSSTFGRHSKVLAHSLVWVFLLSSCADVGNVSDHGSEASTLVTSYDGLRNTQDRLQRLLGSIVEDGLPRGIFFYHTNHLGSASLITDDDGAEVSRVIYHPYGEVAQAHSSGQNLMTHKFTGQELDEESGLYYYNARYYDPTIARFISKDPTIPDVTNAFDHDRYAYGRYNPVLYIDPSGYTPEKVSNGSSTSEANPANGDQTIRNVHNTQTQQSHHQDNATAHSASPEVQYDGLQAPDVFDQVYTPAASGYNVASSLKVPEFSLDAAWLGAAGVLGFGASKLLPVASIVLGAFFGATANALTTYIEGGSKEDVIKSALIGGFSGASGALISGLAGSTISNAGIVLNSALQITGGAFGGAVAGGVSEALTKRTYGNIPHAVERGAANGAFGAGANLFLGGTKAAAALVGIGELIYTSERLRK